MAIYKRDGIFESFPGSGKPTMDDPKIIDLNENHGKIDLPYIKHWILHDPKRAKGAYPTFVEDGVRDLAYRMLIQDAKRDGKTIREDGLENVRMEAIRRFGYAADAFHIGNDIVVGRELSKEDKYKKLAHEVAGADLVAQGKNRSVLW